MLPADTLLDFSLMRYIADYMLISSFAMPVFVIFRYFIDCLFFFFRHAIMPDLLMRFR